MPVLFACKKGNSVQLHSGAQANFAGFYALFQPSNKVMRMKLSHGGNRSNGCSVSVSGKWFEIVSS
ncbi:hypothetical protein ACFVR2_15330 [Gottfriedia sp. NPDC057991]|uniref:hypothetical protein n=1 Tax=Gottfriedia sp. NPDC057991 TaxID=3346298 RepID=UPI0036DF6609